MKIASRSKRIGQSFVALVVASCLLAASPPSFFRDSQANDHETLSAKVLEIRDGRGAVRARLGMDEHDTPGIVFFDSKGEEVISISAVDDGGLLSLGSEGGTRVQLACLPPFPSAPSDRK